jgi:Tol biopolymer transport system component
MLNTSPIGKFIVFRSGAKSCSRRRPRTTARLPLAGGWMMKRGWLFPVKVMILLILLVGTIDAGHRASRSLESSVAFENAVFGKGAAKSGTTTQTWPFTLSIFPGSPASNGTTARVSVASDGTQSNGFSGYPSISAHGRYVAFTSHASNLVPGDTNNNADIFVHDRHTGFTTRVSIASNGTQGNGSSYSPSMSADGRYVAFSSAASNLVPNDTNGKTDVFIHDREIGETTRVSQASNGVQGNGDSLHPSISADARYVAFQSLASNLVPGDTNGTWDIFVHDRHTGQTSRVSVASNGTQGNHWARLPSISADGRYVAFSSDASNLVPGDTNGERDIFVHDRQTGHTNRVSLASDGAQGNGGSSSQSISADGRYVAFSSTASNLIPGEPNDVTNVFLHDRQTAQTSRVSVAPDGTPANWESMGPSISADGRYVAFYSWADNLVPGDTNGEWDVFVHDKHTGHTNRVSLASDGAQGNGGSSFPSISANGRYVAFSSTANNLVPNDTNGVWDVFVHDRGGTSSLQPDVSQFVTDSRQQLLLTSGYADDVSQVGDYFLDKLHTDAVKLVINTTLNLWSLAGIDWGLVGQSANHIITPGYQAALDASWRGWTDASVIKHWHKPLYDRIYHNGQWLFHESAQSGFKYVAKTAGIEAAKGPIKDWLVDELVPGPGTPVADLVGVSLARLGAGYQSDLSREELQLLAQLPNLNLTPAQEDAYRADMLARQQAHAQMVAQLGSHRDLLWNSYQAALANENNWWRFWGRFLLKYAVIGAATLAWDGPGFYVATAGTTTVDTIYDAVQGARALAHDQKMMDQSLRFLGSRTPHTYSQISLNTVAGLNLIHAGQPPQIADGNLDDIELHSIGHYRFWPDLWWAEERSQVQLEISNDASFSTAFLTSAAYTHTGFWSGPQRLLPEGEAKTLGGFGQGTAIISLKLPDDGWSPDDGSPVDLLVLGATATGIYPVANTQVSWNPVRVEEALGLRAPAPIGYTAAEANSAPTLPYRVSSTVVNLPDSTDYRLVIGVVNPFALTLTATITQTIPSHFTILDSDAATIVGDSLVWTTVISPGVGLELRPLVRWEAPPGTSTTMPAAELAFEDPDTGLGDRYTTKERIVHAAWPLEVKAVFPLTWQSNAITTMGVTLTNVTDNVTATGTFTTTVRTTDGAVLWAAAVAVSVTPGQSQTLSLPVDIVHSGYAIVEGELSLGEAYRPEFLEIIFVAGNDIYLPVILRQ